MEKVLNEVKLLGGHPRHTPNVPMSLDTTANNIVSIGNAVLDLQRTNNQIISLR